MGAPRTNAGHAAAKLKAALLSKLGNGSDDVVLRAVNLCDRYLNSCNNSEAGLEVLKEEVKKILSGQDAKTKRASLKSAPAAVGSCSPSPSKPGSPPPLAAEPSAARTQPTPPWMLPAIRMHGRAHISETNPYGKITSHLAAAEDVDDEIRRRNRAERANRSRAMLDNQMEEVNAQRRAEALQRQRDREESDRKIREFWEHEENTRKRNLSTALQIKGDRESQVAERKQAAMEEKARLAREAAKEREKFEKERRRDLAEKAALKRRQEEEIRKAAEENKARLAAKAEERYKEQEESRRIALLQIKMAEEADARREAQLEAIREKTFARYRAAGGEAREADLVAKARADAEKVAREQAERERMLDEDLRRRKREAKERTELQLRALEAQLAQHANELQQEQTEKKQHGERIRAEHAAYEDSLLDAKRKAREDGRREIERRKAEIADENRRKFDELTEQMDSRHLALHGKVLQGTVKPFHYFKAQNPST